MLIIRCAKCKTKLWKYEKIGSGEVLRCYKNRIVKIYLLNKESDRVLCKCGNKIGIDKGGYIKMIRKEFIHTGTKSNNS